MLIFLDFDGVLHSAYAYSNTSLFSQIPVLESFFRQPEYADCQFIVSSTWRINHHLHELQAHFSPDFRQKILGTTPILPPSGSLKGSREREIMAWLRDFGRENSSWIALDDLRQYFDVHSHRVYFCQSGTGLTSADFPHLAKHIQSFRQPENALINKG